MNFERDSPLQTDGPFWFLDWEGRAIVSLPPIRVPTRAPLRTYSLRDGSHRYLFSMSSKWNAKTIGEHPGIVPEEASGAARVGMGKARPNECCYAQILACGRDMGPNSASVLLFFDSRRYVFNVPEGFQRYCTEHHVKLSKVDHIFLTRTSPRSSGGLPGALLTMMDSSVGAPIWGGTGGGISLHGPHGLSQLLNGIRTFVNTKGIGLQTKEILQDETCTMVYQDERVSIEAIVCGRRITDPRCTMDNTTMTPETSNHPLAKKPKVAGDNKNHHKQYLSETVSYICTLSSIAGKFMPEKARELNIPKGPLYGRLVKGEAIVLDGRTIEPQQVVGPTIPGPILLILDCPSVEFLQQLISSSRIESLRTNHESGKLACVIHLASDDVVGNEIYKEWMDSFPKYTQHIVSNSDLCRGEVLFPASSKLCGMLGLLHPEFFPRPAVDVLSENMTERMDNVHIGRNLMKFHLKPVARQGIDLSDVPPALSNNKIRGEVEENFSKSLDISAKMREEDHTAHDEATEEMISKCGTSSLEITFLGTGAAVPSKYRNVTSLYINLFSGGGMLLDAGEGTLGQIIRCYGRDHAEEILKSLKCIWISHIHADHHAGLISILCMRYHLLGEQCEPLTVIGPRPLRRVLETYGKFLDFASVFVDCLSTVPEDIRTLEREDKSSTYFVQKVCRKMKLRTLESIPVIHCAHSFGVVLKHEDGWKFTFSGDTRPCQYLTEKAAGSTLFVHEATFEDALHAEAVQKKHCTTGEAVLAGQQAKAYRTLLTHFSQRYPKIPVFDESFQSCTSIAFDMMRVNLSNVPRLPNILPALKEMFPAENDAEDEQE